MDDVLKTYNKAQEDLFNHVGFVEDWVMCPIEDNTGFFWKLFDDSVVYAETAEAMEDEEAGHYYCDEIYKQRFYDKWVYEGEKYTMIMCDPRVDGVQWFRFFDNSKKVN